MSALGGFRAVGAAAARLFADLLDGPEPCGHDYDVTPYNMTELFEERARIWERRDQSSRAVGMQHATAPGEVSGNPSTPPSPGDPDELPAPKDYPHPSAAELADLPDSTLLNEFSAALLKAGRRARLLVDQLHLFNLADAARDRAVQLAVAESEPLSVSREDLAAHITAVLRAWSHYGVRDQADFTASSLLDDFYITKK
jgi:hypothetical protein